MEKITSGVFTPALGRDYSKRQQIVDDLNAGKDFVVNSHRGSTYCSIRDLADGQYQFRYSNLLKTCMINVKSGVAK